MRVLSIIVMVYMLFALIWWTILLHKKNNEIFVYQKELIQKDIDTAYEGSHMELTSDIPDYARIIKQRKGQNMMVIGEGLVFGISLMLGIWFIYRSFTRELKASERQNNFLLSITHELKSPLTSINLGLDTLKKWTMPHEKVVEISESALGESKRLEKLINDLLTATKLDSSYHYEFNDTNIVSLIEEKLEQFQKAYMNIKIGLDVDRSKRYIAKIDGQAMEIILSNILDNAIKYGNGCDILVRINSEGKTLVLEIADKGQTIPEKERTEVFKKFYRLGSEEVRKTKGTGLGLYITKKMVEAHKGKIAIKENKPKGNIFEIKIPLES